MLAVGAVIIAIVIVFTLDFTLYRVSKRYRAFANRR